MYTITLPSDLKGFVNTNTEEGITATDRRIHLVDGELEPQEPLCPVCGERLDICNSTGNRHFMWFSRLLENHFEDIIAHATFGVSSGKVEGVNNKIKTIRRQGYGYPDDDYFFLKIFDASREAYFTGIWAIFKEANEG